MSTTPNKPKQEFLFDKSNYKWMLIGVGFILLGLILMAGGKSPDPHKFNYDEVYSFRRITLAPILILAGLAIEVFAIIKKDK
jgi:hypothetical protein